MPSKFQTPFYVRGHKTCESDSIFRVFVFDVSYFDQHNAVRVKITKILRRYLTISNRLNYLQNSYTNIYVHSLQKQSYIDNNEFTRTRFYVLQIIMRISTINFRTNIFIKLTT